MTRNFVTVWPLFYWGCGTVWGTSKAENNPEKMDLFDLGMGRFTGLRLVILSLLRYQEA